MDKTIESAPALLESLYKYFPTIGGIILIALVVIAISKWGVPPISEFIQNLREQKNEHDLEVRRFEKESQDRQIDIQLKISNTLEKTTTVLGDIKTDTSITQSAINDLRSSMNILHENNREYLGHRKELTEVITNLKCSVSNLEDKISNMGHTMCSPQTHKMLQEAIDLLKDLNRLLTIGGVK